MRPVLFVHYFKPPGPIGTVMRHSFKIVPFTGILFSASHPPTLSAEIGIFVADHVCCHVDNGPGHS